MWGLWWGLVFMGFMCRSRGRGEVREIFRRGGKGLGIGGWEVENCFRWDRLRLRLWIAGVCWDMYATLMDGLSASCI